MTAEELLEKITLLGASDIFIVAGLPLSYRLHGQIVQDPDDDEKMMPGDTAHIIREFYMMADNRDMSHLEKSGDDNFSFAISGVARYRINAYKQRGSLSAVIRVINFHIPQPSQLGFSRQAEKTIQNIAALKKGLVLVTGPAGSGKSTTLACIIDEINRTRQSHIITLEDPLEYLHLHQKSIVSQREIGSDTDNYLMALRASLRQSPDVILLGDLPDTDTINLAMTAAETGHLILSSLYTVGAANTIQRIIDAYPVNLRQQAAVQLSNVLQTIISQQLVPTTDGKILPVFEIMHITPQIKSFIRNLEFEQVNEIIANSADAGMSAMNPTLFEYQKQGILTLETAMEYAVVPEFRTGSDNYS